MFNKEKETNEAIGMIKDMSKLFEALNTRQSKNTDLTFQTTMRFLTLMEVLVEKRIITPDESTRIMNEGKDG
jgi:hypothetical protein|tara:strand:- start:109 stop:324 length:216 start_codon:yes stop_codon:yes gene_type:complete